MARLDGCNGARVVRPKLTHTERFFWLWPSIAIERLESSITAEIGKSICCSFEVSKGFCRNFSASKEGSDAVFVLGVVR